MDFLDPKKKRAHRIRLMIGYGLVAIALAMGTLILVLLSYGYDLDRKTGTVVQNGLVFVRARPGSADIYINGTKEAHTDTRLALRAGQYSFELRRTGYRYWSRAISLQGGSIERLDYPLLFPNTFKPKDVELYASKPTFATQSPDRRWLVVQQPGQLLKFDVLDLSSDATKLTPLTLPSNLISSAGQPNQSWQTPEWSTDNRHFLVKHHFGTSDEFIMVDRENPTSSFNVNQLFKQAPSQVVLRDKRFDQLYLYASGAVKIGDVRAVSVTPLLTHVVAFKPHEDKTILFISDQAKTAGRVSVKLLTNGTTYTLRELPAGDNYFVDVARFDNRWYMVAAAQGDNHTYIYRDPEATLKQHAGDTALLPAIVLNLTKPQFLSSSDSGRFVAVQSGSHFAVYDADSDRRYYYDLALPLDATSQASWMDDNRLTLVSGSKAVVFDFDGTNRQILVAAEAGFAPLFDPSYKWLYTFAPSIMVPGRPALSRSDLVVK